MEPKSVGQFMILQLMTLLSRGKKISITLKIPDIYSRVPTTTIACHEIGVSFSLFKTRVVMGFVANMGKDPTRS